MPRATAAFSADAQVPGIFNEPARDVVADLLEIACDYGIVERAWTCDLWGEGQDRR